MSKLSITVHSDMQVWHLTWLVTDIQLEIIWNFWQHSEISQHHFSLHWFKCWAHNALKSSPVSVWTWDTARPFTNSSQDCWSRNALAGQGESVCVLQVAFIQALFFYWTSGTLSYYFAVYYFPCWNWVEHPSTIHYLKTLQITKKKRKKKELLLCSQPPAKRWMVLRMCHLWHHTGCNSRTRRKKREKQTKRRLTGCSWLTSLRHIFIRNTNLTFS